MVSVPFRKKIFNSNKDAQGTVSRLVLARTMTHKTDSGKKIVAARKNSCRVSEPPP